MSESDRQRQELSDLIKAVAELKARVATLERTPNIGNTAIDRGALRIIHPSGNAVVSVGKATISDLGDVWGLVLYDPDGSEAGVFASDDSGQTVLRFKDEAGRPVLQARDSDFGLSHPLIPFTYMPYASYTTPVESTTSAAFQSLWTILGYVQTPQIQVGYRLQADVGTTGEAELFDDVRQLQLAGPISLGSGANLTQYFVGQLDPNFYFSGQPLQVDLRARRLTGAGVIRGNIFLAYGLGN